MRAIASSEHSIGNGRQFQDDAYVYVDVGIGVGSAIFSNGGLYRGSNGNAGEFGHTTADEDEPARADTHLETDAITETVEVQTQTPLLQADNATVSSIVTAQQVPDLPLNGRNFVQLIQSRVPSVPNAETTT